MANKPQAKSGEICPLMRKDVSKVCHKCHWYQKVYGENPQTGEMTEQYACAIAWMPMLTIENSQQQRQTGAAVESFRNVMNKVTPHVTQGLQQIANQMQRGNDMHQQQLDFENEGDK